ncbi:MAG: four helix bundle protein [Chloroflexi bacterium]|nr:four helix bundle protein [Chloroflexota bacterium]MCC6895756.1 four helix bundle protein [Anaerolineae bacterium]
MAKGSCGEVRCQLYIALDRKYLLAEDFANLIGEAVKVSKIIAGLAAAVARKRNS